MNFHYPLVSWPLDPTKLIKIRSSAIRLYTKLKDIDVMKLPISDYNKFYFGSIVKLLPSFLQYYTFILGWAIGHCNIPDEDICFIDYGGGSGILTLLAKEYCFGKVIYTDIYDVSCRDARIIGETIGNPADLYLEGGTGELKEYLSRNPSFSFIIVSNNVIEHVYDTHEFLESLANLSPNVFRITLATEANALNPLIKRKMVALQKEVENRDREKTWGHKERDCLKAYKNVRREMIIDYCSSHTIHLTSNILEILVENSRGMIREDIFRCLDKYHKTGYLPPKPSHPTNTCDPYTGNWAERIMNPKKIIEILNNHGFKATLIPGRYGSGRNAWKRPVAAILNSIIAMLGPWGAFFARYYIIQATRMPKESHSTKNTNLS